MCTCDFASAGEREGWERRERRVSVRCCDRWDVKTAATGGELPSLSRPRSLFFLPPLPSSVRLLHSPSLSLSDGAVICLLPLNYSLIRRSVSLSRGPLSDLKHTHKNMETQNTHDAGRCSSCFFPTSDIFLKKVSIVLFFLSRIWVSVTLMNGCN